MESSFSSPAAARPTLWTPPVRAVIFILAATSIACLLTEFYGVCPMRQFTLFIFVPSLLILGAVAAADGLGCGRQLFRTVLIGVVAGFIATVAYDVFRLPFVFAQEWKLTSLVP